MKNNRRDFFKAGGLLSAGLLIPPQVTQAATNVNSAHGSMVQDAKPFDPSKEPVRVRKNFVDLTDEELQNLCKAIGWMRTNSDIESRLYWSNYAKIHALHCTQSNAIHPQVHWSWHFLPWHRGYCYFLERILANILTTEFNVDGTKFALPYWDWSTQREMPNTQGRIAKGMYSPFFGYDRSIENVTAPDNLGFDNSALYTGTRKPTIEQPDMDPDNELTSESKEHTSETLFYTSQQYIDAILTAPFEQFGGHPVSSRQNGQGLLEQGPHNNMHDWVGIRFGSNRDMGTLRSAAEDPVFYMHHANIDRIWSLYTLPQPDPAGPWGQQEYIYTDIDGGLVRVSVQDIVTKCTNIEYAPSRLNSRKFAVTPLSTVRSLVSVNKTVQPNKDLAVAVPNNFGTHRTILADITTGVINNTAKGQIKIFAGDVFLGKINWMDGAHRQNWKPDMTHVFSVLLTDVPKNVKEITFRLPKNYKTAVEIKSIEFKPHL